MRLLKGMKVRLVKKLIDFENDYWCDKLYKYFNRELDIHKEIGEDCVIIEQDALMIPTKWLTVIDCTIPNYMKSIFKSKNGFSINNKRERESKQFEVINNDVNKLMSFLDMPINNAQRLYDEEIVRDIERMTISGTEYLFRNRRIENGEREIGDSESI